MKRTFLTAVLALLAALALGLSACGSDDDDGGGGGGSADEGGEAVKAGVVTDVGGLNDRSFNALANKGRLDAQKQLGAQTRVLISKTTSDYIPNLSTLAQQGNQIIVSNGFLMADATNTVASKLPNTNFAIIDYSASLLKSKPKNVQGLIFKEQEGGYLVGYLAGLWAKDNNAKVVSSRGRPEDPARGPLHRRLRGRGQEGVSRDRDAERLLPNVRRPGSVQGDRAGSDREGVKGHLPGGRQLRPGCARRRQAEGRPGHRRRRRPGLPRRPHPHERAEEGRRGGVRRDPAPAGGQVQGRHRRDRHGRERRRRDRQDQPRGPEVRGPDQEDPGPDRRRARSRTSRTRSSNFRRGAPGSARPRAPRNHEEVRPGRRERPGRLRPEAG